MNKLIYLAGPITGLTYGDATDWRTYVRERLNQRGIRAISPLRGKDYLEGVGKMEAGYHAYDHLHVMSSGKGLTTRDRYDVMRSDAIFVNFLGADERVSIGTVGEIFWADAFRRPVILCMEDGNLHDHAMVKEICGYHVHSLDAGIDVVRWLFAEDL